MNKQIRNKLAYSILALSLVLGIWALTNRNDKNLRRDINKLGTASCISGIQTVKKYNDFVDSQIQTQRESLALAIKTHDMQRAKINRSAIIRYTNDKILPPTVSLCKKPILP